METDALVEGSAFKDLIIVHCIYVGKGGSHLHFKDEEVLSVKGDLIVSDTREYRVGDDFGFP